MVYYIYVQCIFISIKFYFFLYYSFYLSFLKMRIKQMLQFLVQVYTCIYTKTTEDNYVKLMKRELHLSFLYHVRLQKRLLISYNYISAKMDKCVSSYMIEKYITCITYLITQKQTLSQHFVSFKDINVHTFIEFTLQK